MHFEKNANPHKPEPAPENDFRWGHVRLLLENFRRLTGKELHQSKATGAELAREIYDAPFVLLSHGTEEFPVYTYANRTAQKLFGYTWEEFTALESRYSAVADDRSAREELLREVKEHGFINNYRGTRIRKDGGLFTIENVIVWNLTDEAGVFCGQAATFDRWEML